MCLYWEHNSVSPGILIIRCWTLWMDGPLFRCLFKPSIEFLNFGFHELSFLFSEGFGLVSAFCSGFMDAVFYLLSCVAFCFLQVPFDRSYLGWVRLLAFIWEPFLRCLVPLDWTFILSRRHSDLIGGSLPASEPGSWGTARWVVRRVGEAPNMGFRRSFLFTQKRNPLPGSFCTCFPLFRKLRASGCREKRDGRSRIESELRARPVPSAPELLRVSREGSRLWGQKGLGTRCSACRQPPWFWSSSLLQTLRYLVSQFEVSQVFRKLNLIGVSWCGIPASPS